MERFQPGEAVSIDLVFQNPVPIKDANVIFVHEDDENEHILFGLLARYADEPLGAGLETSITDLKTFIPKDAKPGVYALDRVSFQTFGERTLDGEVALPELPKFEVIPEREGARITLMALDINRG